MFGMRSERPGMEVQQRQGKQLRRALVEFFFVLRREPFASFNHHLLAVVHLRAASGSDI